MVDLHLSERLFHFAEDPNRFGHRIRQTIAFEPRDQPSLTLNASALVENISLADLDWRLGLCGRVGHVIQTPTQSKSSRKPTPATFAVAVATDFGWNERVTRPSGGNVMRVFPVRF